jgi:hypothetical protein
MISANARLPRHVGPLCIGLVFTVAAPALQAQSLLGSPESMQKQNDVAHAHDYAYLRTPDEVQQALEGGDLIPIRGNEDFELAFEEVSFPVARPQVKTFLEQLSRIYHGTCGEPLVVTSLTRPITRQPWNASPISVHPTGMAVDLRRSDHRACRTWLEKTLLSLEAEGMVQATLEHYPPHYHIAVFPDPLLLPGPIGDPDGVARLAALHEFSPSERAELASTDHSGRARLSVARSKKTGRLQITQTVAHHTRGSSARSAVSHGSGHRAVPAVKRTHRSRSSKSHAVRTAAVASGSSQSRSIATR